VREALKVGISGVRGVVGQSFTPQLATSFAQAFGVYVGGGAVVVGRDTRTTGPMVEHAVVAGLLSVGCKPILAGVAPTPTVLILTGQSNAAGGIAITASHNAAPWNALKFIGPDGLFLRPDDAGELLDVYHQQLFPMVAEEALRRAQTIASPVTDHFARIAAYVDAPAIRNRQWNVAVDCCNGVGALYSREFLAGTCGCRVTAIHERPDGRFERPPEPLPANLAALGEAVRAHGCDIGFAQDPDGDRLAIVDETGCPLGEDLTLALGIRQVLACHRQGPIVVNLTASRCVDDVVRPYGQDVVRTPTGEINVSGAMLRLGAVAGGEGNGGLIVPDVHPCRDSYTAMALILELMTRENASISALRASIPRYSLHKEVFPIRPGQAPAVLRHVRRHFANQRLDLTDGVYVDGPDFWIHIRRSNTEPILRLTAEAHDPDALLHHVANAREQIRAAL
jgi:phosphomannomutase